MTGGTPAQMQRCAHQRGHQHVLRVGQRVAVGEEDRRVKQGQRIARNDMRDPRDHEDVEAGVVVVEPRQSAGIAGEGPGVQDGRARRTARAAPKRGASPVTRRERVEHLIALVGNQSQIRRMRAALEQVRPAPVACVRARG